MAPEEEIGVLQRWDGSGKRGHPDYDLSPVLPRQRETASVRRSRDGEDVESYSSSTHRTG